MESSGRTGGPPPHLAPWVQKVAARLWSGQPPANIIKGRVFAMARPERR